MLTSSEPQLAEVSVPVQIPAGAWTTRGVVSAILPTGRKLMKPYERNVAYSVAIVASTETLG